MKVFDPQGNELVPMLVQIVQRDDKGKPIRLRVRHGDEMVGDDDLGDLAELGDVRIGTTRLEIGRPTDVSDAKKLFLLWAPAAMDDGVFNFDGIGKRMHDIQLELEDTRKTFEDARLRVTVEIQNRARVEAELEQKTVALRELQKERDPERLERMVKERCAELERKLDEQRLTFTTQIAEHLTTINELRASKKKLREALERTKHHGK